MRRRRSTLRGGFVCVAVLLGAVAVSFAYFTATGAGSASAGVTALSVPGSPAANGGAGLATVTWTAATISGTVAASSYTVERYDSGGTDVGAAACNPVPSSSGVPNAFGSFSCTDTPVVGTYKYKITAHYNAAWTATTGFTAAVTVAKRTPALAASSPATGTTGTAIPASGISSTLSGATVSAGGTITFTVFGPQTTAPSSCTTGGTTVGTATVSGNGTYHPSAAFTPSTAGTYWWYASYNGDTNNNGATSTCGAGMSSTSVKNQTASTATGPATGTTSAPIPASAITSVLSGATAGAGGTITFTVFGPQTTAPSSCTTGGSTVGTATVSGNGTYQPSAAFTPSTAGTYWWYASYNGDTNNNASNSTCGSSMSSTVVKNGPANTASAPATDTTSTAIATSSISSVLSGATSTATGTITFKVFGPQTTAPTSCTTGGTTVGTATVSGNGTYHPSAAFTPSTAGTYWWYASYNGDTNNNASNSTCGTGMSATTVWSVTSAATASAATGSSATTSNFTVAANTTYLLLVFRHSSASDSITSISSTGLTPALSTPSFSLITSQNFGSIYYQWAYSVTTGASASGTGTLTVNFKNALVSGITLVDLVRIAGNNLTTPVVSASVGKASGTGTTATANLAAAPAAQDAELAFLAASANLGGTAPAATGLTNLFYSRNATGSAATYSGIPAVQNSSFTISTSTWGTLTLELAQG